MTEDEFAAYQSLSEETEDHRWAFGTGFTDPLEGIDTSVPDGVDAAALAAYCLMLGDDALVYSHRLQQWMTRMPELEEETALANIALDLLGQARMLLSRAGRAEAARRGDGNGGPPYAIRDEFNRQRYIRGAVGMALSGPETGGSQYFLTLTRQPHLDGHYTVFGILHAGFPALDRIVQGDAITQVEIH